MHNTPTSMSINTPLKSFHYNTLMKKAIFSFILFFVALAGNAQVKHMSFYGIPIDGTVDDFQMKLVRKGFEAAVWKNNVYLEGTYMGEPIRLQNAIGPRTGKVAIVAFLSKKECNGQTILSEVERWKTKLKGALRANFYESRGMYKAEVQSPGRGTIGIDYLQSDPTKDLYVVRVMFADLTNLGK